MLRDAGLVVTEPCGRSTDDVLRPVPLRRLSEQRAALADAAETALPRRTCP